MLSLKEEAGFPIANQDVDRQKHNEYGSDWIEVSEQVVPHSQSETDQHSQEQED